MATKLYTMGNMRSAYAQCTPTPANLYPAAHLVDSNVNTWCKLASAGTLSAVIDLGRAETVDAIICWIHNYGNSFSATTAIDRYYSDNGTSWTFVSGGVSIRDTATPLRIATTGLGSSHRYWKVNIPPVSPVPEVAMVACCREFTIEQGYAWPETNGRTAYNVYSQGKYIRPLYKTVTKDLTRTFLLTAPTDIEAARNAFDDSGGQCRPLVLWESSTQADALLARFASDTWIDRQATHQFWKASIQFKGIPHADTGDNY